MSPTGPIVAVTVTYNPGDDLAPFLASVYAQQDCDWHLVVIDNASRDGTPARLAALADPRVTVIFNDANLGVAAANNQGIGLALQRHARDVLIINNDTEFGPGLFAGLARSRAEHDVAAVSPLIPYFARPDRIWFGGGSFRRALGILNVHDHRDEPLEAVGAHPFAIDYAPTCCLLVDAAAFATIGVMDEDYFVYWDDTDFCWRLRRQGLGIMLDPRLRLLHKVSRSTGGDLSDFTIRYAQRNQMLFVRKHFGLFWVAYTAVLGIALGCVFWIVGRTDFRQLTLRLRALREGLAMPIATAVPAAWNR